MKRYYLKLNKNEDGFVCQTQEQTKQAIEFFKKWGQKGLLTIQNPVSNDFRGYYFAGIIGFIHKLGMYPNLAKLDLKLRFNGVSTVDVYHESLKRDFNGINIQLLDGSTEKLGMSVAIKDTSKFYSFVERINEYVIDNFGMPLPTPEEYKEYRSKHLYQDTGKDFTDWYIDMKGDTTKLL